MSRLVGGLLLFLGCSLLGSAAARMYRMRVEQLDAFLRIVRHIRDRIELCLVPIDRILEDYECDTLAACGFLLAARELGASDGFASCRERLLLTDSQTEELASFFASLGRHAVSEESSRCTLCERSLSAQLELERAELAKRSKLCRTFGSLTGLLISILLL